MHLHACAARSCVPHATVGTQQSQEGEEALRRYRLQPEVVLLKEVAGAQADSLAAALPGLVVVQGSGADRRAVAADARQHEKLLEKVGAGATAPAHAAGLGEGMCAGVKCVLLIEKTW